MNSLQLLFDGFQVALQPENILFALIGCALGTAIGVLPGVGPAAGTAILIPVTAPLNATSAIIMLAAIYYGAMYGGTVTSVLINTPGEAASAITCIDGYQMAKQGRAGPALGIAAIGSFIGGTVATFGLVFLAPPLAQVAVKIGPPEYFALMVFGILLVTALASTSLVRALISGVLGLMVGMVGIDPEFGVPRLTFGQVNLLDGVNIVPIVMGLFGVAEVLLSVEQRVLPTIEARFRSLFPSKSDLRESSGAIARGTGIGFTLGLIPGINAIVAAFISYIVERKVSKTPERFGQGMIQGVAGPETANNALASASLIPLFTLGIPSGSAIAILAGAFISNGLTPGPLLFTDHPQFVWGVIASLYVGNVILLVLNLPLIPVWVAALRIPRSVLFPLILGLAMVGSYSLSNRVWDIGVMFTFGAVGYFFKKLDIPSTPFVLTLILGPTMESSFRQSLDISGGDPTILFTRPISAALLFLALGALALATRGAIAKVQGEDED